MSTPRTNISRRDFLKYSAAAYATARLGRGAGIADSAEPADLVLLNGKIITVNATDGIAQAVAVQGNEIQAVGADQEIRLLIGPTTRVIDLAGKTVTPGIVDSHLHPLYYGRQFWDGFLNIRYPFIKSLDELLAAVRNRASTAPKGQWISGNQGFSLTQGSENFDKVTLDGVAPEHPVYLRHGSGQYSVVNSLALARAGIDVGGTITPNPFGGKIVRDPDTNEATGTLLHYPAENLVMLQADGYKGVTVEDQENDLKRAQDMLLAAGITSGQDVIVGNPQDLRIYKNLADRNELKLRMYLMLYINSEQQAQQYVEQIQGHESDFLTFGGWKLAIDGGVAAGTTLMYNNSLPCARQSYYYYEPEVLNRIVRLLHETGRQISFHIIGDKGIDQALDAVEAAVGASGPSQSRHRIEHAMYVAPQSLNRIKQLGMVISTQPQWISWYGDGYRRGTDEATMSHFVPIKSMLDMGIPVAFGCDVPAAPFHHPKWALIGATLRRTATAYVPAPNERIDMHAALRTHTMGSAYAAFEEDRKGSIEVGKLADMVVWNDDLYALTNPQQAGNLEALLTIVGGEVMDNGARNFTYLPNVRRSD